MMDETGQGFVSFCPLVVYLSGKGRRDGWRFTVVLSGGGGGGHFLQREIGVIEI